MISERAVMLDDERRLALLHCVLSHHGAAAAPGGRFGSVEALTLHRLNALDAGVKGAFEHGLVVERPRGQTVIRIGGGAARAWWPIQSSKLAGPGSPRLGRFDSFAASWLDWLPRVDAFSSRPSVCDVRVILALVEGASAGRDVASRFRLRSGAGCRTAGHATAEGRLSADELDQRLEALYATRT